MKRHRARKAQGLVLTPQIPISPYGVKLLAENGWLAADAPIDSKTVGDALRRFINASLKQPQKPKHRVKDMMKSVTAWIL